MPEGQELPKGYLNDDEVVDVVKRYYRKLESQDFDHKAQIEWTKAIDGYVSREGKEGLEYIYIDSGMLKRNLAIYEISQEFQAQYPKAKLEELRLQSSDLMGLQYLLSNERLDKLIDSLSDDKKPKNSDEMLELKTALTIKFLNKIRKLHKEGEHQSSGKYVTTLGCEWEISPKRDINSGATPVEGESVHKSSQRLAFTPDFSLATVNRPETNDPYAFEAISFPSLGHELQLLELLYLIKSESFDEYSTFHVTFGGVEINPENTQVMDLQSIAVATGWFKGRYEPYGVYGERFKKPFRYHDKLYYFPGFLMRKEDEMMEYGDSKNKKGVEFRASWSPSLGDDWYEKFANTMKFYHCGVEVIHSIQKPQPERDVRDSKLIEAWGRLLSRWGDLLKSYNLTNPAEHDGGRYLIEDETGDRINKEITEYERFNSLLNTPEECGGELFTKFSERVTLDFVNEVMEIIG